MTNNSVYKCCVCGNILRFRYQVGFSNIPVNVYCPKCNSHIFGEIAIDNENVKITESINNAIKMPPDTVAKHVIELSSEFISKKCQVDKGILESQVSMFLRNNPFDSARTERRNSLTFFINNTDEYIRNIENIFNLLQKSDTALLKTYLNSLNTNCIDKVELLKSTNYLDMLIASKHFLNIALKPSMSVGVFEKIFNIMSVIVPSFAEKHPLSLKEFVEYLSNNNYFDYFLKRIPKFIIEYLRHVKQLAPIYDSYNDYDKINLVDDGVTTLSVYDMAVIYKNGYELICDSLDLIIGLYNIENKGTYDNFDEGLAEFGERMNSYRSKYKKYEKFTENTSKLFDGIRGTLNNVIRNAEGHNSIVINGLNQEIQFIDKYKGNERVVTTSFIEFGKQCMDIYFAILYIWEYYYQLFKAKCLMVDKMVPHYFPFKK